MTIRFNRVTKTFGTRSVLKDISFEVGSGEILFILGKSGVGKSVTLKHIVGLLKPDNGRIYVDDDEVTAMSEKELSSVRCKCGMVFQQPALLDSLTVLENVSFGLKTAQYAEATGRKPTEHEIHKLVVETLSIVNLSADILDKFPSEISYGMQKRVSLARTLAPKPKYLLFDEPTTGLDPITVTAVNDLINELSRKLNVTSLVVSHDMNCALGIADRILVLDQGRILALDKTQNIRNSEEPLIREFLAEALAQDHPDESSKEEV